MKKAVFIILVMALVFMIAVPVSLGAPEDDEATGTDDPQSTEDVMPDDAPPSDAQTFELIKLESAGMQVFRIQMRLRALGYLNYRPTGQYKGLTQQAVIQFQQNNGLSSDGQIGQMTFDKLFSDDVVRKPLSASVPVYSGPALGTAPAPGEAADWATVVDAAFPAGATATVTDYNSGKSFAVERTGGTGHADVKTVDAAAYTTFLECFGVPADAAPTWEKRAVLVTVGTSTYAASMFGHPTGIGEAGSGEMKGHVCLYFKGSTSDVLGFVDKEHYKMVLVAAGLPLQYQ